MSLRDTVNLEVDDAKREVLDAVNERGQDIKVFLNDNFTVDRDGRGSTIEKSADYFEISAFPVIYNPNQKQIEKAGLVESADALIYTAKLAWENRSIDFKYIDSIVSYIIIDSEKYKIKEKGISGQHANDYIYITLNLSRFE